MLLKEIEEKLENLRSDYKKYPAKRKTIIIRSKLLLLAKEVCLKSPADLQN